LIRPPLKARRLYDEVLHRPGPRNRQAEDTTLRATSKEAQTAQSHADEIDDEISHTPKTRRCLMCHTQFESTWAGERVCRQCKSSSQWRSGALG